MIKLAVEMDSEGEKKKDRFKNYLGTIINGIYSSMNGGEVEAIINTEVLQVIAVFGKKWWHNLKC